MLCLGKILQNLESNDAWEQRLGWIKSSQNYRNFDRIDGEPMEFEWKISQDSIRCSSTKKSKVLYRLGETPEISQEEFYSCRCSTTFLVEQETMNKNVWQTLNSYLCMQEDLEKDNGHLLVLVLRNSGTVSVKTVHKESVTILRKRCWWNSPKADVQIFRASTPLSSGQLKSKGHGKLSIHYAVDQETSETIFSHNCFCEPAQSLRSSCGDV